MAKGTWLTEDERKEIKRLFFELKDARKVSETVGREKSTVLKIVKQRQTISEGYFNYNDFQNSMT